ncbi:hypothetical protein BDZ90DRAFT_274232 [Jaminaea rosea]|uniref:C2 domain-containing protein n=1 Tax=Jaminaea rosea TaxID=1569628 RepID=A0A316UUU7_9BASI|nr:hypothetical protein BDZ90DRAFT_274232 [Jaminaea rosea]PWN28558.1 hypothetical protein BDZ90DRAFT_274232 [Jaminaea rosea]
MSSAPLAADAKHKGTLACVVLKAKNLPNKRSIGKQDPFAVLSIGEDKKKTKADKRGGQHPTWDEQLHFEIYDDIEDVVSGAGSSDSTPSNTIKAGSAATATTTAKKPVKSKKILKVACYADDNREPDFIGEGLVDLTGVLKTGEFDEWVTIKAKDRYAGEVYLELTFFSSGPRPKRKKAKAPQAALDSAAGTYGGAGTFTAEVDEADFGSGSGSGPLPPAKGGSSHPPIPSSMMPANGHHGRMSTSASTATMGSSRQPFTHSHTVDDIPSSLRPSSSLAGLATYTPPYAPAMVHRASSPQPPPAPGLPPSSTMPSFDDRSRRESMPSSFSRPELHSLYTAPPSDRPHGHTHMPSASSYSTLSQIPSSFSTSSMASIATIRPNSAQPPPSMPAYDDPINDLMRPMSSMSMAGAPPPAPYGGQGAGQPSHPHYPSHAASAPPSSAPPNSQQQPYYQPQQAQQQPQQPPWEHARPPANRVPSSTYGAEPSPSPYSSGPVAPTPPPQSTSAPPATTPYAPHSYDSYQGQSYDPQGQAQGYPYHAPHQATPPPLPQATQMVHPAQTFIPTQGSTTNLAAAAQPPPRPSSPATSAIQQQPPQPPPPRPTSTSGYHALPPLPSQGAYRAPSPAGRPQPLPTPPPPSQHQHQHQPPSVINAQSLYQPGGQAPPPHGQQRAPSPSPSYQYDGRVPSPAPSAQTMMSHSASQSQMSGYSHGSASSAGISRPLPPPGPHRQPSYQASSPYGAPQGAYGQLSQQGQQQNDPYQGYGVPQQGYGPQSQPPPPAGQGYAPQPSHYQQPPHQQQWQQGPPSNSTSPLYQPPAPEQPAYIQSPYDAHGGQQQGYQQQQQQQQQPQHYQQPQQQPYHQQGQPQPPQPPQQRQPAYGGSPY